MLNFEKTADVIPLREEFHNRRQGDIHGLDNIWWEVEQMLQPLRDRAARKAGFPKNFTANLSDVKGKIEGFQLFCSPDVQGAVDAFKIKMACAYYEARTPQDFVESVCGLRNFFIIKTKLEITRAGA